LIVDKGSDFFLSFFLSFLGLIFPDFFFSFFSFFVLPRCFVVFLIVKAILFAKKALTGFYDKHASEVRQLMGCVAFLKKVSIRQHMSAYVSIRRHTSAYVGIRQRLRQACKRSAPAYGLRSLSEKGQHTSAYVSICQHMSAYVSIRRHTSAFTTSMQAKCTSLWAA
jgi:hypothetical protein